MKLHNLIAKAEEFLAMPRPNVGDLRLVQAELLDECHRMLESGVLSEDDDALIREAMQTAEACNERWQVVCHAEHTQAVGQAMANFQNQERQRGLSWHQRLNAPLVPDGMHRPILRELSPSGSRPAGVGRTMASLFGAPHRSSWDHHTDFYQAIASGRYHPYLVQAQGMTEGNAPAGGFLVPEELAYEILDQALHQEVVRPYATVVPMTTRTKMVPSYDGMDQSQTARLFGFEFRWLEELEAVAPGQGKLRALQLTAWSGGIYVIELNKLALDIPNFGADLTERIAAAVAENLDASYLTGDGVSKPQGILVSPARYVVAPEGGQAGSGSVIWENVTKMFAHQARPQNAIWVCNPLLLPGLMSLTIAVGTAGGSHIPAVSIGPDGGMTLLTRPLLPSSKAPPPGTEGDISFCDMSAYYIGLRNSVNLEMSPHAAFTSNASVWRGIVRTDGIPKVSSPYTGRDGQAYSPFVVLGARP